jgi:hypothetical protein
METAVRRGTRRHKVISKLHLRGWFQTPLQGSCEGASRPNRARRCNKGLRRRRTSTVGPGNVDRPIASRQLTAAFCRYGSLAAAALSN